MDEYQGFIIEATSAREARKMASKKDYMNEEYSLRVGGSVWKDPKKSTCKQLKLTGEVHIVMSDFNSC